MNSRWMTAVMSPAVRTPIASSSASFARVASPGRSHSMSPSDFRRVRSVSFSYWYESPSLRSLVNWKRIASSVSSTLRMIRDSASFLHARAKAFLGSMSRAAFGSRPDPDRASTSSKWRIAPPAQFQVMISPCSSTPAATVNGRPLVFGVLIAVAISRVPEGGTWGGDDNGVRSQGQDALDGRLLDVERGDCVDLVADRRQVARLVLDDQGDEPGLGRALPGDERRPDL